MDPSSGPPEFPASWHQPGCIVGCISLRTHIRSEVQIFNDGIKRSNSIRLSPLSGCELEAVIGERFLPTGLYQDESTIKGPSIPTTHGFSSLLSGTRTLPFLSNPLCTSWARDGRQLAMSLAAQMMPSPCNSTRSSQFRSRLLSSPIANYPISSASCSTPPNIANRQ